MKRAWPVFLVFLAMGFGDVVGPLVTLVKETFQVSNFTAQLVPLTGFLMFGLLSVPMGLVQDRKGKKFVLLLGLSVALAGALLPIAAGMYGRQVVIEAGDLTKFYVVLASILLLCAGATILQVCGNPVMRDVSPPGTFASNLSLAQSVKAVGSSMGFLLLPLVAKPLGLSWSVQYPIFAAALLVALCTCLPLPLKAEREESRQPATLRSCFTLFGKNTFVLTMVLGIFFYVGAEVCFNSGVPLLLKERFGLDLENSLWVSWSLFFLPILVGRFAGAAILRVLKPALFLKLTAVLSLAGIAAVFSGVQALTYAGIVVAALGFANIFPLIFSIAVDAMPDRANEISGLMISAIAGGAILPPVMGWVVDLADKNQVVGFAVPFAALLFILWLAMTQAARQQPSAG
ncbi:MAG TPA: MFS transporter [Kiritimatiellia bacterium]|jgi:fucose permease|nr:MFS transporter [Kiritimatiellia bacterium]HQA37696.1 MFS transporter [Kiritimatiellia bacterium]HQL50998.1 MFS transporter [Kiritimatiellia bacterium]HQQ90413.1 MFS transporter [Kiritimatiellia bacterium]